MEYQYIGSGDTPPKSINFMGKVKFTLNHKYVDVTDPVVLKKIENHPCFKLKVKKAPKKAVKKEKSVGNKSTGTK